MVTQGDVGGGASGGGCGEWQWLAVGVGDNLWIQGLMLPNIVVMPCVVSK